MSKVKTRSSTTAISDFIGPVKDFIPSELPTNRAVIQKGILLKEQKNITCNLHHNKYSNKDLASDLIPFVLAQWRKANVKLQQPVIIGEKSLYYRIKTLWEKVENVVWKRTKAKVKEELLLKLDKLMDLITCPDKILLCEHDLSGCSSPQKAYEKRMKKLQDDQASFEVTEIQDLYEEYQKNISPAISLNDNYNPVNVNFTLKQDNEIKLLVERLLKDKLGVYAFLLTRFLEKKSRKNTMSIKKTPMASIRFGISPAATSAIATSYLQDLIEAGFLTPEYSYLACDPSKLMRARKKVMVVAKNNNNFNLPKADNIGIYFNGKKDSTRAMINDSNGQLHLIIIKEQHITVTIEPGGRYLGHFTPNAHTHSDKLKRLLKVFIICCDNIILLNHV
ncbi:uncharacterized protein LOC136082069 [Hydra vulgaris]|uniref:Uncharacterized protein LOC136082069 n=1 Tax=Hydra vulgaris TaxID=6087 RepID=A0ABM4C571_HYDVU